MIGFEAANEPAADFTRLDLGVAWLLLVDAIAVLWRVICKLCATLTSLGLLPGIFLRSELCLDMVSFRLLLIGRPLLQEGAGETGTGVFWFECRTLLEDGVGEAGTGVFLLIQK